MSVEPAGPDQPKLRVGVEHEYQLWRAGQQVDFRTIIADLTPGLRTLDPGDPRARRLPSGVALTADGWEAELATPPLQVSTTAPGWIDALLRAERTELLAAGRMSGIDQMTGFSTHLNVSVNDEEVLGLGRAFAEHCLGALADILQPAECSGMFVRPRRGRLEVGGEYAEGDDLCAALILLVACVDSLTMKAPPPVRAPLLTPSREKFGWYAATTPSGQLSTVWVWARPAALRVGLDPAPVDRLALGSRPTRRLRNEDPATCTFAVRDAPLPTPPTDVGRRTLGSGIRAETEWLTWDHAVWVFTDHRRRTCRAVVPVERESRFLAELAAGRHDECLGRMLRRRRRRLRVHSYAQLTGLTWCHELRPEALVPAPRAQPGRAEYPPTDLWPPRP